MSEILHQTNFHPHTSLVGFIAIMIISLRDMVITLRFATKQTFMPAHRHTEKSNIPLHRLRTFKPQFCPWPCQPLSTMHDILEMAKVLINRYCILIPFAKLPGSSKPSLCRKFIRPAQEPMIFFSSCLMLCWPSEMMGLIELRLPYPQAPYFDLPQSVKLHEVGSRSR